MISVCRELPELVASCDRARERGDHVGLVPTMGALHDGHLALIDEARRHAQFVVLTIFVNPRQFGPNEDFARYPRTLDADVALAAARGVDLVFAPAREAMYPPEFQTHVTVDELTTPLEGTHRPGHFEGVTTVVAKLLILTGRCTAIFGRKDYQQWRVIERMAADLCMPVRVVGHPIVREPDGLALSSRNRYLDPEARERARCLSRGLAAARRAHEDGERSASALAAAARTVIEPAVDRIDYVALVDPETLGPCEGTVERGLVAIAAHIGTTRLIDNTVVGEPDRSGLPP